jgi:putative flippase GtrA
VAAWTSHRDFWVIVRYCQAGALNAAFGFALYALLIWLGLNMYAAQLLAHVVGVAFNYVTYSRHVFRETSSAKVRFVASYAVNYAVSVAFLFLAGLAFPNPYIAGFLAIIATAAVNFLVLKNLVFSSPKGS